MKTNAYITMLFSLIAILSGFMATSHLGKYLFLVVESGLGVILFINVFFMIANKKWSFFVSIFISFLLAIFYGYNFSGTTDFFHGLLTVVSVFVGIINALKIIKIVE